ncbi:hypothetical protein SMICM17S_00188 [Streptomyces microflavus]
MRTPAFVRHTPRGGSCTIGRTPATSISPSGRVPGSGQRSATARASSAIEQGLAVGQHRPPRRREFVEVDPGELAAADPEHPLPQHGVVAAPPGEDVGGGDEVHGPPRKVGPSRRAARSTGRRESPVGTRAAVTRAP